MGIEGQSLTEEDQLFILMQAALYLSDTRGLGSLEARICHERAESLCHSLNRPLILYLVLEVSGAIPSIHLCSDEARETFETEDLALGTAIAEVKVAEIVDSARTVPPIYRCSQARRSGCLAHRKTRLPRLQPQSRALVSRSFPHFGFAVRNAREPKELKSLRICVVK
jgi:hypothetical protein